MKHETQVELLTELQQLSSEAKAFLDKEVNLSDVSRYTDPERFDLENAQIISKLSQPIAHSSELPKSGSFLRRELAGLPLLIVQ